MFDRLPGGDPGAGGGVLARVFAWLVWIMLALVGLGFLAMLLFWLILMAVVSLVAGLLTGRPSTVGMLWQQYRTMARNRWPRPPPQGGSRTPRADAARPDAESRPGQAQDVDWRDVSD